MMFVRKLGSDPGGYIAELSDDFNRANSATLGGGWEASDGNWTITSNVAEQTTGATDVVRYSSTALSTTDMWVRATRLAATSGAVTVCLRMNSTKTEFYMAGYNTASGQWLMWRFNGGTFTTIGSHTETLSGSNLYFRLEAQGSDLRLYRADPVGSTPGLIISATDSTFAHSYVGIRGNSTGSTVNRIDDFAAGRFG